MVGQELVNVRVRHVDMIRVVTPVGVVLRRIDDGQGDNVTPVKFIFHSKGIQVHYVRGRTYDVRTQRGDIDGPLIPHIKCEGWSKVETNIQRLNFVPSFECCRCEHPMRLQ